MKNSIFFFAAIIVFALNSYGAVVYERDEFQTSAGKLVITFFGHSSFRLDINGKSIYIDPWSKLADFAHQPKADLILLTHEHYDHLDTTAISNLSNTETQLYCTASIQKMINKGLIMKNGDIKMWNGIKIEAVPAYNLTPNKEEFHPKSRDNGYILTIGDKRFYIAGDSENTPEMKAVKNIDVAFLPMNQPYTMTPEQLADAAAAIHPKILYPYHTGETDLELLKSLMLKYPNIELRIRSLK